MAEQILIEFIGDASQLQPAIDVLEQMGQIDSKAADSFRKSNVELSKKVDAFKKVNTEAGKQIKTLKDVEVGVTNLSDAFHDALGDTVLKGIGDVGDKMATLQKRAKDAGKSVLEIVAAQEQLKQKLAQSQSLGPFQKMAESVKVAEQKVLSLAAKLNGLQSRGINDGQMFDRLTKELPEAQAELEKLRKQYDAVAASIDKNKSATTELNSSEESLKKQLREMTAQLAQMELAGQRNTAEYNQLVAKAGEVKDAINDAGDAIANAGSDTRGMDNLISLAGGVAGGFAVAQGAAALFGTENEEVQKILLKVNAAMAILQGLQQIQDLMSKRQFASTAALLGLQRVQFLQTKLQAAAESEYILIRYGAIAAQKILNAVMASNPIGLVIAAIAAIAIAIQFFTDDTREAAKAQAELNDALKKSTDYLDADLKALEHYKNIRLATAKANGASSTELDKLEGQLANKRLKRLKDQINENVIALNNVKITNEETAKLHTELEQKQFALQTQLQDETNALEVKGIAYRKKLHDDEIKSYAAFQDAKVFQARKGSIAELEAQINAVKARRDAEDKLNADATPGERAKNSAEALRQIQELSNQITIKLLENEKFLMEAKLATIQEGSVAELEERKKIAAKAVEIEAAAFAIGEAQKKAILASGKQEQEEFARQIIERKNQIELNGIKTQLAYAQEGSDWELKLKLDELEKEKDLELGAKGVANDKKEVIEAEYLKKVRDLNKQYNLQVQQDAIAIKQSEVNAKLALIQNKGTSETDPEVLQLKKQGIDLQKQADINATVLINNEEQKQAKIQEIIAKATADKLALDQDYKNAVIQNDLELTNLELENEAKRIQIRQAGGGSGLAQRIADRQRLKAIQKEEIDNEVKANEEKVQSHEEYLKKKAELDGKYLALELQQQQEAQQRRQQIIQAGIEILQQISTAYFEQQSVNRQADLDQAIAALESEKNAALNAKNITEQQKDEINTRYAARERQLKLRAFEEDKKAKRAQAYVAGALAIIQAYAQLGPIGGSIAAAGIIVATGLQISKINQSTPGFKGGTKNAPRGYAWVGEEGPELVYLTGGEKIYTYHQSKTIASKWEKNNYQTPYEVVASNIPNTTDQEFISNSYVNNNGSLSLDYDKLSKAIAKQMPEPIINNISWDENGFRKDIIQHGNKTEIRNSRYKMNS